MHVKGALNPVHPPGSQAWVDAQKLEREAAEKQDAVLQAAKEAHATAEAALKAAKEAYRAAKSAARDARKLLEDPPPRVRARLLLMEFLWSKGVCDHKGIAH